MANADPARFVLLVFALADAALLVRMFWTGRVYARHRRLIGTRETHPGDFWLQVGIGTLILLFCLGMFAYLSTS
jgi:hypothetical protein